MSRFNPNSRSDARVEPAGGIWMVAERGIHKIDGYSTRVRLALEAISEVFPKPVLFYPSETCDEDPSILSDIAEPVPIPVAPGKPLPFLGRVFRHALESRLKTHGRPALVYGQNLVASDLASRFSESNSIPFVFDYHGVAVHEIFASDKSPRGLAKAAIYLRLERRTVKRADKIVVVSNNFRRSIEKRYRRAPDDVHVFPMVPEAGLLQAPRKTRGEIAAELGVDVGAGTVVFTYLGQAQTWQLAAETVAYYARIEAASDDTFLLIISNDRDRFSEIVRRAGVRRCKTISVPHADVPRYLDFCDFGFVFRRPILVNTVASPTKVMEYLSRGVLPVMTGSVGDFSEALSIEDLATIVPFDALKRAERSDRRWTRPPSKLKDRARRYASSFRDTHIAAYDAFLREMVGSAVARNATL